MLLGLTEHPAAGRRPPYYEDRAVAWRLDIPGAGGRPAALQPVDATMAVPTCHRTSGVQPALAADRATYVLGWHDGGKGAESAARRHESFVGLLRKLAASGHAAADAAVRWYAAGGPRSLARPRALKSRDLMVVAVDGVDLIDDPAVQRHWRSTVIDYKGLGRDGVCLVCGRVGPLMHTIPSVVVPTLLPGAEMPMALVSNNSPAAQFDLGGQKTGLAHSPICATCADRFMSGLRAALTGSTHVEVPGQAVRHCWWYNEAREIDWLAETLAGRPKNIGLLDQLEADRDRCPEDARVYSGMFAAAMGRVVPRDWRELSLRDLLDRIATWWRRVAVQGEEGLVVPSIASMCGVLGRYDKAKRKYGTPRWSWIYERLSTAMLDGRVVPATVVAQVIGQVRCDGHVGVAREALLAAAAGQGQRAPGAPGPVGPGALVDRAAIARPSAG